MNATLKGLTYLARTLALVQIVTGFAIWLGWMPSSAPHIALGSVFVLVMWIVALLGLFILPQRGLPLLALLWGALTIWFGMAQTRLLPGATHWTIRIAHLIVGIAAVVMVEGLSRWARAHIASR